MGKKFEGESRWYMTATGGEYSLCSIWESRCEFRLLEKRGNRNHARKES